MKKEVMVDDKRKENFGCNFDERNADFDCSFCCEVASPQQSSSNTTLQTAPNKVDPIQRLESIKAKVTQKYNEGKISKNKYDSIIAKINNMEQQINDFNEGLKEVSHPL